MREKSFDLIQYAIDELVRASNVQAVLVCDTNANAVAMSGSGGKIEADILQVMASSVFPATKRLAEKSRNANEAQSISFPEDDVHLLVFWLGFDYFLLVSFSKPTNPYAPPESTIKACNLIRLIMQGPERHNQQVIFSAGLDLQTAVYVEQLVYSNKVIKELGPPPSPYDLSYMETQCKKIVEIAKDILSGKKGVIEGARHLVLLRANVTRDNFDPDFLPFVVIVDETEDLPVGKEREYWASNVLSEKDKEIQQAEEFHREKAFAACRVLPARFEKSS